MMHVCSRPAIHVVDIGLQGFVLLFLSNQQGKNPAMSPADLIVIAGYPSIGEVLWAELKAPLPLQPWSAPCLKLIALVPLVDKTGRAWDCKL